LNILPGKNKKNDDSRAESSGSKYRNKNDWNKLKIKHFLVYKFISKLIIFEIEIKR